MIIGQGELSIMDNKKVLILSNHFITLYSFRKELIKKLIEVGSDVYIALPESADNKFFVSMGCKVVETAVDRRGINPFKDFLLICKYVNIICKIKPDIILSYTIKPNIYGSIASRLTRCKQICNITGTGATFLRKSVISEIAKILYKLSVKTSYKIFFQNNDDKDYFIKHKMVDNNYTVIPGSGVNLDEYPICKLPSDEEVNFIFIGRVMNLKGIDQFLECAKVIKGKYKNTNFYIAGFIEEDRYKDLIDVYYKLDIVKYIGFQKDIKSWIQKCHCTILPSHGGEGVPNVLLESAAMARVCIASRISGSKEVIEDGKTGYLFEAGNASDLISKIENFLSLDYEAKVHMGLAGRKRVEKEFDRAIVIRTYLNEISNI